VAKELLNRVEVACLVEHAPITEETIDALAVEAERGYTPGQLRDRRRGPGRPPLGEAAKSVESVRLDPALRAEAARRAARRRNHGLRGDPPRAASVSPQAGIAVANAQRTARRIVCRRF
jgi:hypothetical protein